MISVGVWVGYCVDMLADLCGKLVFRMGLGWWLLLGLICMFSGS